MWLLKLIEKRKIWLVWVIFSCTLTYLLNIHCATFPNLRHIVSPVVTFSRTCKIITLKCLSTYSSLRSLTVFQISTIKFMIKEVLLRITNRGVFWFFLYWYWLLPSAKLFPVTLFCIQSSDCTLHVCYPTTRLSSVMLSY